MNAIAPIPRDLFVTNGPPDLFICLTPLQVLVASRIAQSIPAGEARKELCLLAKSGSRLYTNYLQRVAGDFDDTAHISGAPAFPWAAFAWRKRFGGRHFRTVYVSSINNLHVHFMLSFCRFERLVTFDDGTANIVPTSSFHQDRSTRLSKMRRLLSRLLGNRHTLDTVRHYSESHLTIYAHRYPNIHRKVEFIELFLQPGDIALPAVAAVQPVRIFLGTVYGQVVRDKDRRATLVEKVARYLQCYGDDLLHLPHPRDDGADFAHLRPIPGDAIAEEVVMELLQQGNSVELVGFANSTQFFFHGREGVRNIVLASSLLKSQRDTGCFGHHPNLVEVHSVDE